LFKKFAKTYSYFSYFLLLQKENRNLRSLKKLTIVTQKSEERKRTCSSGKLPLIKESKRMTTELSPKILEENQNYDEITSEY
jgi:hypothetical protein